MNHIYRLFILMACVFFGVVLSNCQRASYSFQLNKRQVGATGVAEPTRVSAVAGSPAAFSAVPSVRRSFPVFARPLALRHSTGHRQNSCASIRSPSAALITKPLARVSPQKIEHHRPASPDPAPERRRSKGIALLLAVLLGGFGAHRFYLGYYGEGAAYVGLSALAILFLTLGFLGLVFASTSYSGFLVVAAVLSIALQGWLIADIVRIVTGNLKPKNGEYYTRFFQTSPDPGTPPASPIK